MLLNDWQIRLISSSKLEWASIIRMFIAFILAASHLLIIKSIQIGMGIDY